jgi:cytochrome c oxidase cbb3-type subunit IV
MKFIHYLEKISGVSIYALSSFMIFGLFFLVMLTWAIRADKKMINEISEIPLK